MTEPWIPHDVEFVSDFDRPELAVSPWAGHRWFAYDLVRWARPARIVELGTHYGCSYFAFCQALQDDRSGAEVLAIDTWEGEEHSGLYTEEVFDFFTRTLERRFASVNVRIQRSLFDDALDLVPDGSVDILHIDGLHTYEAVTHDYETWKAKVAPNGIVLFHDVAPSSNYGSANFWQEIRETAPGFAFYHSFGLGVLLPNGSEGREALLDLARSPWRSYYQHRAGHDLRHRQVVDLTRMVDARDEALAATEKLVDDRDAALVEADGLVQQGRQQLQQAHEALGDRERTLAETRANLDRRDQEFAETERTLTEARFTIDQRDRELADAAAQQVRQDEEAARQDRELARLIEANRQEAEQADARRIELEEEIDRLRHHISVLTDERDAYAANLDLYRRTLRPVRWASQPPRRLLRRIRSGKVPELGAGDPAPVPVLDQPALFDPAWYLARYPDIGRAGVDPWSHWTGHGWKEGREPCPLFDAGAYLEGNPDVAAAGVDPLVHWIDSGWREDRDPSGLFSTSFYRSRNGRKLDQLDPLQHYLDRGLETGLFVSAEHERLVLGSRPLSGAPDEVLTEVVVHHRDGTERPVPYSLVVDLDADLFTFDLWDTILTRTRPADSAKLATARRLRLVLGLGPDQGPSTWDLMAQRVEIEAAIAGPANGEYLLGDVLTRQLGELGQFLDRDAVDLAGLAGALRRAELEDEMASTVPIEDTVLVMEKLLGRGGSARVAVLSDFYLAGDDLRELLSHHGIGGERLDVVSSADHGLSKHRDGALFGWVRQRYGVEADRHVHIGDNPHADVAMQTAAGGTAVHLRHGRRRFVGPGGLDQQAMADVVSELQVDLDAACGLRCRQSGLQPRSQNRVLRAAWRTALLPVALVAAAVEDATARDLDRIHYLSREGLFLSRVHEVVAPVLWPDRPPAGIHLAVSRRSTFGPSLTDISTDSLLDLWRMYSRQTPRGLLVSIGAEAGDFAAAARRHGLELDEVIDGVHLDQRIRAFIGDREVKGRLQAINAERRTALLAYLGRQTDLDLDRMLVVDVGWRGTVQDNLARLLPDTHLVGWYLALFPFLNPQPANGEKHAVGPDGNQGDGFAFMEPPAAVERPWTPAAPSVVDYRRDASSGSVPVLDEESLDEASRAAIALYQDAVIEAAPAVARWIVANGAATDVLRPLVGEALRSYYTRPEPGIADLWFDSAHDDTFGVLNVTSFGKARPGRSWLGQGPGPGFLRHLEEAAEGSLWPSGYRRWRPVEAAIAVEKAIRSRGFDSGR